MAAAFAVTCMSFRRSPKSGIRYIRMLKFDSAAARAAFSAAVLAAVLEHVSEAFRGDLA